MSAAHPLSRSEAADGIVRWQPLACLDLFCELHSPAPSVLHRAKLLFLPRNESCPAPESASVLRWRIQPLASPDDGSARRWRLLNLDSDLTHDFSEEQHALTFIEYFVVQSVVERVQAMTCETPDASPYQGLFALHGALLCKDDCAIIIVGPSKAGKSTLACALWQSGWTLLSDDFSFTHDQNTAYPAARRVSLRCGSRDLVGRETWDRIQKAPSSISTEEGWLFHPHEVDAVSPPQRGPMRIKAFIILERPKSEALPAQLKLHDAAMAAFSLLPFCTLLPRPEGNGLPVGEQLPWGAALSQIGPVVTRVPVYDLGRGPLSAMVEALEKLRESL